MRVDPFFVEELLSEEEREIRGRVRAFSEEEIVPIMAGCWERAEFPSGLVPKLAGLGICGDTIKGYGCAGLSAVASGLVAMELARGDGSVYTFFGAHSGFAMNSIAALGSKGQKEEWLPQMARMEKIGAFALTEPNHGSDVVLLETRARREDWASLARADTLTLRGPSLLHSILLKVSRAPVAKSRVQTAGVVVFSLRAASRSERHLLGSLPKVASSSNRSSRSSKHLTSST